MSIPGAIDKRRLEIDHLRIIGLGLLIIYHVLCVYAGGWRVESSHAGHWGLLATAALYPWRMALIFFIGGVAARFLLEKQTLKAFAVDRTARLLIPFAFAVLVLVPPQVYVRLDEMGQVRPGYLAWLLTDGFAQTLYHGVRLPVLAHAWFLPYLFAYCLTAALAFAFARKACAQAERRLEAASIGLVLGALIGVFAVQSILVEPWKPQNNYLFTDIAAHLRYAPVFALGFLTARSQAFLDRQLKATNGLALLAGLALPVSLGLQALALRHTPGVEMSLVRLAESVYGAAMLLAIVGLARRAFKQPAPGLAYAADAIMPIYLLHQTVLIIAADVIVRWRLPLYEEAPLLIAVTCLAPLTLYHLLIRRSAALRLVFGMRQERGSRLAPAPPAQGQSPPARPA